MLNREIPFRPRLEGDFRIRFYNAVSRITENTTLADIENIADEEIKWVTSECTFNLDQRKKYRAVWFLFRDLIHASWKALYRDGVLYMNLPILNGNSTHDGSAPEVKQLLRSWMSESRHERLLTFIDFIKHMEARNSAGHDISELIADGPELANRIEQAHAGRISIKQAVQPYLQLVTENERDQFTGLKISEIWRYFRLTWSTPSETTPGRTMQYLIRDAAHPMHAVMGIASLENCAVQITCRDDYIGWNQHAFIENILTLSGDDARLEFQRLLGYIEDGISGIDYSELCTEMTVRNPTDEDIRMLLDFAANAEQQRQDSLRNSSENGYDDDERSELGSISTKTEQALYNRKRAEQLARLLIAKKTLTDIVNDPDYDENWINFCKSETGSSVIRNALVAQKTKHIGSSLMELNVCGAIPPYNEILGGKLVALLATSPQVVHDYKTRYENKASEIASRLKGQPVCRPAELVYVGTTSLYYVGSSQYNRLKIPGEVFGSDFDVVWKRLGMTIGFGTMHISKATTLSLTEATSDGFNRINHVFGEGASPKMRLLTMAIRELIEATNEDSKDFSKHAMSRIVYGACLASNASDYLLGKDDRPHYYTDMEQYEAGTQKIIDYWSERLICAQIKNDNNTPTHNFWMALSDASDYFSFEAISDFVAAVGETNEQSAAIPANMWRLNLLSDPDILSTKNKPADRLRHNRELIIAIGQLSEDSRKKLSRSLARTKTKDKDRLQTAYRALQNFYKYAQKSTLQELDFSTVQELFSASQKKEKPQKPKANPDDPSIEELGIDPNPIAPIRPRELDTLISDAVVFGDEDDSENIKELLAALRKHYDTENDENEGDLPLIGGIFGDRPIVLENNQTDLRKLVGRVCNDETWGALIETEETVLKDAISADIKEQYSFNPKDEESLVAFKGGIDGGQALFDFLTQFDSQFAEKQIETAEPFLPIIKELIEHRNALCRELDMIMYHPVLLFGSDEKSRNLLINYIRAWEKLYHAFNVNEPTMRQISAGGTGYVARALLLLDVLYIKTPKEWKAIEYDLSIHTSFTPS